jgi:hypothetical protein
VIDIMKNIFFVIVVLAVLAQALHTQAYGKLNKLKTIKTSYKKLRPSARGTVAKRLTNPPKVQLPKLLTKKPSVGSNIGISPGQCFKHVFNGAVITVGLGTHSGPNQFIIGGSCPTCNDGDMVPVNSFDQDIISSTLTAACGNWGSAGSGSPYKICEALDASGCTRDPNTGVISCQGQTQCDCKFNNIQESHVDVHGNKVTYNVKCSPTTGYQYAVYIKPFGADSPTAPVTVTITNDAQVVNAPGSGIGGNSGNGVSGNNFGGGGNPLSGRRRRRLLQGMSDT